MDEPLPATVAITEARVILVRRSRMLLGTSRRKRHSVACRYKDGD